MTVTVDINIALDVFQNRQPHYAASAQLIGRIVAGQMIGVFPAHGLTTLYYLMRKHASRPDAEFAMDQVLCHFQIVSLDGSDWKLKVADFEDAVVATVAERSGSAFIVTRNVADFAGAPIPAITPSDFLAQGY